MSLRLTCALFSLKARKRGQRADDAWTHLANQQERWRRQPPNDRYEAIFTALAHPARRRILISLNFAGGAMTAGEIAGLFGHAWPTTTRHLQLLEAGGLVTQERASATASTGSTQKPWRSSATP